MELDMALAPRSAPESATPNTVPNASDVREQLERLLTHPLFCNSKRYPALLAYTVDQTLLGSAADLKERSIGIEVFGRTPSYDANADPVVRITAGEVRKRLTQYYYDSAHAGELVIELPVGSYVPTFRNQVLAASEAAVRDEPFAVEGPSSDSIEANFVEPIPTEASGFQAPRSPAPEPHPPARWLLGAALVVLGLVGGLGAGLFFRGTPPVAPPSSIDRFWAPVTSATGTATYCLGEPAKNLDVGSINSLETPPNGENPEPLYFRLHYSGHLALADVITLTRTAAALETRHKVFRIMPASEASFSQLREGPIVLIGGFDNIWTLRITQNLRFGFESKDGVALIVDRKSPKQTTWATAWDLPYKKLSRDYAIVARIHDKTTGQPVVIAAGISEEGTESAGEILYNPVYLDTLLAKAPVGWDQMNMEAVIETQVIDGHPGPPNVLAVEFW
jgi:hypothetical protein